MEIEGQGEGLSTTRIVPANKEDLKKSFEYLCEEFNRVLFADNNKYEVRRRWILHLWVYIVRDLEDHELFRVRGVAPMSAKSRDLKMQDYVETMTSLNFDVPPQVLRKKSLQLLDSRDPVCHDFLLKMLCRLLNDYLQPFREAAAAALKHFVSILDVSGIVEELGRADKISLARVSKAFSTLRFAVENSVNLMAATGLTNLLYAHTQLFTYSVAAARAAAKHMPNYESDKKWLLYKQLSVDCLRTSLTCNLLKGGDEGDDRLLFRLMTFMEWPICSFGSSHHSTYLGVYRHPSDIAFNLGVQWRYESINTKEYHLGKGSKKYQLLYENTQDLAEILFDTLHTWLWQGDIDALYDMVDVVELERSEMDKTRLYEYCTKSDHPVTVFLKDPTTREMYESRDRFEHTMNRWRRTIRTKWPIDTYHREIVQRISGTEDKIQDWLFKEIVYVFVRPFRSRAPKKFPLFHLITELFDRYSEKDIKVSSNFTFLPEAFDVKDRVESEHPKVAKTGHSGVFPVKELVHLVKDKERAGEHYGYGTLVLREDHEEVWRLGDGLGVYYDEYNPDSATAKWGLYLESSLDEMRRWVANHLESAKKNYWFTGTFCSLTSNPKKATRWEEDFFVRVKKSDSGLGIGQVPLQENALVLVNKFEGAAVTEETDVSPENADLFYKKFLNQDEYQDLVHLNTNEDAVIAEYLGLPQ